MAPDNNLERYLYKRTSLADGDGAVRLSRGEMGSEEFESEEKKVRKRGGADEQSNRDALRKVGRDYVGTLCCAKRKPMQKCKDSRGDSTQMSLGWLVCNVPDTRCYGQG